ncbi:uncharacterized protein LOC107486222 [Arachis duranensis]|uniref:Uncharacterized protein LOC107486222 n=1 Tax=Arachis duranensis TaxID=130453 RepID=A0A6P4D7V4_ARADU|nr:uncharacterized protein LOC107486222 [Arachis duranensis]
MEVNPREDFKALTMEAEAGPKEDKAAKELKENKAQEETGSVTIHVPKRMEEPKDQLSLDVQEESKEEQLARILAILRNCKLLEKKPPYMTCLKSAISENTVLKGDETVALCDLRSNINLRPLFVMKKLGIQKVQPTKISLEMADKSLKWAYRLVKYVLVKVEDLYLSAVFVIVDTGEDRDNSIILGRSFLATIKALIDIEKGELVLKLWDDHILFKIPNPHSLSDKRNTTVQHLVFQPSLSV